MSNACYKSLVLIHILNFNGTNDWLLILKPKNKYKVIKNTNQPSTNFIMVTL